MSYLDSLKSVKDRKELAELLGYKPRALTSIIYKTPLSERYHTFEIPKKGGGQRLIKAPSPKLKKLQLHLAHLLTACLAEIEETRDARPVSYGFRKGGSITANAKNHKRRRFVLNLDIQDFFPTINFGRVRGFFLKDNMFQLHEEVATAIAQIACDGNALPQGSPCSPIISELVGQILDLRMLRLAKKHGVRYSRYADDITFSTNQKNFPVELAVHNPTDPSIWDLGDELNRKIEGAGFLVNPKKTRMHIRGSRQMVTGLVVNEKVNIKKEYYRRARAMCDALFQDGSYYCHVSKSDGFGELPESLVTQNINHLDGVLSHIYAVTQSEDRRDLSAQRKYPRAIRTLYRRFLFYKYCVALAAPLIITEGKTDPVYLREAIRYRSAQHPVLGSKTDSAFKFMVRFYNYKGQAHEVMDLGGGTGDLKSIVVDYLRNLSSERSGRKPFKHMPMQHPVILLLDNDDGLGHVAGAIKKNFDVKITTSSKKDFYHIRDNLYVVKTPEGDGKSCIEDLFPDAIKGVRLNGKKFCSESKIDHAKEYSKEVFANSVIKPKAHEIDFSDFDPLLGRICAVISDYSSRLPDPTTT